MNEAARIHVACAADTRYVKFCAAMLSSVLHKHAAGSVQVHFLHDSDIDPRELVRLQSWVTQCGGLWRGHCIPKDLVQNLPVMQRIPALMWYRIFLPELLPDLDRILYLDADILVRQDLHPLWSRKLGEHTVAAVNNVLDPAYADHAQNLGLTEGTAYFNSGVLLFNLARMRTLDCTKAILDFAQSQHLIWPDQDGLNAILGASRLNLHPRWNCQNTLYYWETANQYFSAGEINEAVENPAILHFEGPGHAKPWHQHCKHPLRDEYRHHLQAAGYAPIQKTPLNVLRQAIRLARRCMRRLWKWK